MSNFIIYGRECSFPGIPFPTLQDYGPLHNTHLLAYRPAQAEDGLLMHLWLRMLAKLQAIDRLKIYDLGDGRIAALFDYSGDSRLTAHLDILERYAGQIFGTNFLLVCPYRVATHQIGRNLQNLVIDGLHLITEKANENPALREKAVDAAEALAHIGDVASDISNLSAGSHKETAKGRDGIRAFLDQHGSSKC